MEEEIWINYKTTRTSQWGPEYVVSDIDVSNLGNVRVRKWLCKERKTEDVVKVHNGRKKVGKQLVYHLVDMLFRGPLPKGWVVHHKDLNPLNDSLDNLVRMTRSEHNALHLKLLYTPEEWNRRLMLNWKNRRNK